MATKKVSKKKSVKKSAKKSSARKPRPVNFRAIKGGTLLEYGDPIRDAVARGDINELRKLADVARKQMQNVEKVLSVLEENIQKAGSAG
jgi:hypothetical protein